MGEGAKGSAWARRIVPVLGYWEQARKKKKKRGKKVGDLCSGPRPVSASCSSAESVAGLQFPQPVFPFSGLSCQFPWGDSLPQKLDRGLFSLSGEY